MGTKRKTNGCHTLVARGGLIALIALGGVAQGAIFGWESSENPAADDLANGRSVVAVATVAGLFPSPQENVGGFSLLAENHAVLRLPASAPWQSVEPVAALPQRPGRGRPEEAGPKLRLADFSVAAGPAGFAVFWFVRRFSKRPKVIGNCR